MTGSGSRCQWARVRRVSFMPWTRTRSLTLTGRPSADLPNFVRNRKGPAEAGPFPMSAGAVGQAGFLHFWVSLIVCVVPSAYWAFAWLAQLPPHLLGVNTNDLRTLLPLTLTVFVCLSV